VTGTIFNFISVIAFLFSSSHVLANPPGAGPTPDECLKLLKNSGELRWFEHPIGEAAVLRIRWSVYDPFSEALLYDANSRNLSKPPGQVLAMVEGWKIDAVKDEGSYVRVVVVHPEKGQSRSLRIQWNKGWEEKEKFFSEFPLANAQELPPGKLLELVDPNFKALEAAELRSLKMREEVLASALYHLAPDNIEGKNASLVQGAIYAARRSENKRLILQEGKRIKSARDLLDAKELTGYAATGASAGTSPLVQSSTAKSVLTTTIDSRSSHLPVNRRDVLSIFLAEIFERNQRPLAGDSHISPMGYSLNWLYDDTKSLNFNYLIRREFELPGPPTEVSSQWKEVPDAVRRYWINGYRRDLNLRADQLEALRKISEETEARSEYLFLTDEPLRSGNTDLPAPLKKDKSLTIKGAMTLVFSSSNTEWLPLERFTGFRVERPAQGYTVELGRFYVDGELRPLGPEFIWKAASIAASKPGVTKIVAETSREYAEELMRRFGFRKVHEQLNFEGKTEYIIEVSPGEFFSHSAASRRSKLQR